MTFTIKTDKYEKLQPLILTYINLLTNKNYEKRNNLSK